MLGAQNKDTKPDTSDLLLAITQKVHEPEVPQRDYRGKNHDIFVFHIYNLLKTTQTLNVF